MNLSKKKKLAKKTFNVGLGKIVFLESRLEEIKDAITKQDIRDLKKSGAIVIKKRKGRTKVRKKARRSTGNIRKKVRRRKKDYMVLTRKLRAHLKGLYASGEIAKENLKDLRKKIRNKEFRSKAHLKEHMEGIKK